jgi:hypothetical protein
MLCYKHALRSFRGVELCLKHLADRYAHSAGGTRLDCPHTLAT